MLDSTNELFDKLDIVLSNDKVKEDVSKILIEGANSDGTLFTFGDENERKVLVPNNVNIEIITKALFKEYFEEVDFGVYRVMVAIGGIEGKRYGVLFARYFFATLWYNKNCELNTIDFHIEMR